MKADLYRARRAAGLCTWSTGCRAKSPAQFCARHAKAALAAQRDARAARYMRQKLAGLCVIIGCNNPATDCTVACAKHRAMQRARDGAPDRRAMLRESTKRSRAKRVARGKCGHCGREPLVSQTMGETCLETMRARVEDLRAARGLPKGPRQIHRCTNCGREKCRRDRCPHPIGEYIAPLPPLLIETFATARAAVE